MPKLDPEAPVVNSDLYAPAPGKAQGRKKKRKPEPEVNIHTLMPMTGEPYWKWLDRRFASTMGHAPAMGERFAFDLATSTMSDSKIAQVAKVSQKAPGGPDSYKQAATVVPVAPPPEPDRGFFSNLLHRVGEAIGNTNFGGVYVGPTGADLDASLTSNQGAEGLEASLRPLQVTSKAAHVAVGIAAQTSPFATHGGGKGVTRAAIGEEASEAPKRPSPLEIIKRAIKEPAGNIIAQELGLDLESTEGKWTAGSLNLGIELFAGGVEAKVARGLRASTLIPRGGFQDKSYIAREVFNRFATDPAGIVKSNASKVGELYAVAKKGNLEQLIERFPVTGQAMDPLVATDLLHAAGRGRSVFEETLVARMSGKLPALTRQEAQYRKSILRVQAENLRKKIPADLVESDAAKEFKKRAGQVTGADFEIGGTMKRNLESLDRAIEDLGKVVDDGIAPQSFVALKGLPDETMVTRLRDAVRRGDRESSISRILGNFDKPWGRKLATLPDGDPIPIHNKAHGREQVALWGNVLNLPREDIDDAVARYTAAGSKGETRDVLMHMLSNARGLPVGMKDDLTQQVRNSLDSKYLSADDPAGALRWTKKSKDGLTWNLPYLDSQLADSIPMPPAKPILEARRYSERIRRALDTAADERTALKQGRANINLPRAASNLAVGPSIAAARTAGMLTSTVWRPMKLMMRASWTLKVVGVDEHARLASAQVPSFWSQPFEFVGAHLDAKALRQAELLKAEALTVSGRRQAKILKRIEELTSDEREIAMLINEAPEEVLSGVADAVFQGFRSRPYTGTLQTAKNGGPDGWEHELQALANSKVGRQMARTNKEATRKWLMTHREGKSVLAEMKEVLADAKAAGHTFDDWLDLIDSQVKRLAPTPQLRDLVANGRATIDGTRMTWGAPVRAHLKKLSRDGIGPKVVLDARGTFNPDKGLGSWQNFVQKTMKYFADKPSNLSRSLTYATVNKREVDALVARGIPKEIAARSAQAYAVRYSNDLLYDLGKRAAWDTLHPALFGFFPAWREVGKNWAITAPNRWAAPGVGQILALQRAKALKDFGEDMGFLGKEDEESPYSIKIGNRYFPVESFLFFGKGPGLAPAPSWAASKFAKDKPKVEKFLKDSGLVFTPDQELGPGVLNKAYWAAFQKPPPWEHLASEFQQNQWNLITMRNMQQRPEEFERIAAMKDPKERKAAMEQLIEDAQNDTSAEYVWRMTKSAFLPYQPLTVNEPLLNEFYRSVEKLPENERSLAYQHFREQNPTMGLMLLSRSYKTTTEVAEESSRMEYARNLRKGWIKTYTPAEFAGMALADVQYQDIMRDYRVSIDALGGPAERLRNFSGAIEAGITKDIRIQRLRDDKIAGEVEGYGKRWYDAFQASIDKDKPLDFRVKWLGEFKKNLRLLSDMVPNADEEIDKKSLAEVSGAVNDALDQYLSDDWTPAGEDGTVSKWFREVYRPYQKAVTDIYNKREAVGTDAERAAYMEQLRAFRDAQKPVTIDGVELPTPEEFGWGIKDNAEKGQAIVAWAMNPPSWTTRFQREKLGMNGSKESSEFWEVANRRAGIVQDVLESLEISPSSKKYVAAQAVLESWARGAAKEAGVADDYALVGMAPYERVAHFGIPTAVRPTPGVRGPGAGESGEGFDRLVQMANAMRAPWILNQGEDGNGKYRKRATGLFFDWVEKKRAQDDMLDTTLDNLHAASYLKDKSREQFYDYFIWRRGGL